MNGNIHIVRGTALLAGALLLTAACDIGGGNSAGNPSSTPTESGSESGSVSGTPGPNASTAPTSTAGGSGGANTGGQGAGQGGQGQTVRPTVPAAWPRCHTWELRGTITGLDAAAGNRYARLILTNVSGHACRTYGWVGLQLTGAPTSVIREGTAARVVLPPGRSAWARLHWGAVPTGTESTSGPCEPTASGIRVIPPDETSSLSIPWGYGPVCGHGAIYVTPLAPGTGA